MLKWCIRYLTLAILLIVAAASATTIRVPADQSTIQAGIDAALESDTVLVAPGTYTGHGNYDLDFGGKNLVLKSEEGPQATVIDGRAADPPLSFHNGEGSTAVVDGLTFARGFTFSMSGGSVVISGASPTFRNCVFKNNHVWPSYSVYRVWECNEYTEQCGWVYYCSIGNSYGGAVACFNASPTFINCRFTLNSATCGGALYVTNASSPRLYNTIITGNLGSPGPPECPGILLGVPPGRGGGVYCGSGSTVLLDHCTIVGNSAEQYDELGGDSQSGHAIFNSGHVTLSNCIIAFNGYSDVFSSGAICGPATLSFSNVFGNFGGDWVGDIEDQAHISGNISADPLFCDAASGNYSLDGSSPCLPALGSGEGEWIGALSVGCGDYLCGDVNWDGELTEADLHHMRELYFSQPSDWFLPVPAGDMDCSGMITIADLARLAGYIYGYGPAPCCAPPPKRLDLPSRDVESGPGN